MADTIIPNVVVSMPSQLFTLARSFKAAANGRIYIGKIDTDPTIPENQIQVYLENEDGTHVPIAQPIIINSGGYPVYGGQIAKFVTVQGHSMAVYDAFGVQQFYFQNVLKYDPDQLRQELSGADGFKYIGKVSAFSQLQTVKPAYIGQLILLRGFYENDTSGSGEFVAVSGSASEVPGQIAPYSATGYWKRIATEVRSEDCGLRLTLRANVTSQSGELFDVSDAMQQMYWYAIDNNMPISWHGDDARNAGFSDKGFYITKSILAYRQTLVDGKYIRRGLGRSRNRLNIFVHEDYFSAEQTAIGPAVFINTCGTFDASGKYYYGTLNTSGFYDPITIRNFGPRSIVLHGQIHMMLAFNVSLVASYGFNGSGVRMMAYDGIVQDVRAEKTGNINNYGIYIGAYPYADRSDESNSLTLQSLVSHSNYEKGWYVAGSKTNLQRVHDEDLTATISSPPTPSGIESRNGYGYTSAYFSSVAGAFGTIAFGTFNSNSTITPVITIGNIAMGANNVTSDKGNISVIAGDPNPRGGSIGNIRSDSGNVKILVNARVSIDYLYCADLTQADPESVISAGRCNNILTGTGSFNNFTVNGDANFVSYAKVRNVTVNGKTFIYESSSSIFSAGDCDFKGDCFISNQTEQRAIIQNVKIGGVLTCENGSFVDLDNCNVADFDATNMTSANVRIYGGQYQYIRYPLVNTNFYTPIMPVITSNFSSWQVPTTQPNIGTTTINPQNGDVYFKATSGWRRIASNAV